MEAKAHLETSPSLSNEKVAYIDSHGLTADDGSSVAVQGLQRKLKARHIQVSAYSARSREHELTMVGMKTR